tara:strand:- start:356 stop:550 length:195 start_codon:yes stop_codon:yes gene_type:complete
MDDYDQEEVRQSEIQKTEKTDNGDILECEMQKIGNPVYDDQEEQIKKLETIQFQAEMAIAELSK